MVESQGKQADAYNRDLHNAQEITGNLAPGLAKFFNDKAADERFREYEKDALRYKKKYQYLATTALCLLVVSLLVSAFLLISSAAHLSLPKYFIYASWIGVLPLTIGAWLAYEKPRQKWIQARYGAERIRCWTFQQFMNGSYIEDRPSTQNADNVKKRAWDRLQFELNQVGSLEAFIKRQHFPDFDADEYEQLDTIRQVISLYITLRVEYQLSHFEQMIVKFEQLDRKTEGLGFGLVALSAVLVFIEAFSHIYNHELALWAAFGAIVATILNVALRVYRSAALIPAHLERYASKANLVSSIRDRLGEIDVTQNSAKQKAAELIVEMEKLAHEELVEFLRTARTSSYVL